MQLNPTSSAFDDKLGDILTLHHTETSLVPNFRSKEPLPPPLAIISSPNELDSSPLDAEGHALEANFETFTKSSKSSSSSQAPSKSPCFKKLVEVLEK